MVDVNDLGRMTAENYDPELVEQLMKYQPWNEAKQERGAQVVEKLTDLIQFVVAEIPPSATRTSALRHITDLRMELNAAITHADIS